MKKTFLSLICIFFTIFIVGCAKKSSSPPPPVPKNSANSQPYSSTVFKTDKERCLEQPDKEWQFNLCVPRKSEQEDCEEDTSMVWIDGECKLERQHKCELNSTTTWVDRECLPNNEAKLECNKDSSMTWDNNKCKPNDQIACENDDQKTWKGDKCLLKDQVECEKNASKTWAGGECQLRAKIICDKDSARIWQNNKCHLLAQLECEKNTEKTWVNNQCLLKDQVNCNKNPEKEWKDNKCVDRVVTTNPPSTTSQPYQREAETFDDSRGIKIENKHVAYFDAGDFIMYKNVNFGSGRKLLKMQVAGSNIGGVVQIKLDSANGPILGELKMGDTGGWWYFLTREVRIKETSGVHNLYFVGISGNSILNFDWFELH